MRLKQFPILYGQDSLKRIKTWHISVEEGVVCVTIVTKHGLESGRKIETRRELTKGKNVGRSNETSVFEQGVLEAKSRWKAKKEKELYTEDITKLEGNSLGYMSVPRPMLAHVFNDHKLKIGYPCYTQPKLDGYRAIYYRGKLYSRQGKEFMDENVSHILQELKERNIEWILDGELYSEDSDFNSLGLLRKKKLTREDQMKKLKIHYYVYDIVDENLRCCGRQNVLDNLFIDTFVSVKRVFTETIDSEKDMKEKHLEYTSKGYEGTMIRNINSMYECKVRSYNLQKFKDFIDDEFEIIGYTMEQGGLVVWRCRTEEGKEFSVQSTGTKKERALLYMEGSKYVGKKLWVKFFEYTPDRVPRFPKTMRDGEKAIRQEID